MKRFIAFFALLHSSFLFSAESVKLIFDTDMGNDVDDLIALCMINNLQSRGTVDLLADEKNADGSLRYPHDLMSGKDAPEAVGLIKKILAAQPDHSVVIAQVGFFTNLARLLDDAEGKALVAKKVKLLSIMAGAFQTVNFDTRHLEYNVKLDDRLVAIVSASDLVLPTGSRKPSLHAERRVWKQWNTPMKASPRC